MGQGRGWAVSIAEIEVRPSGRVYTCLVAETVKADDKPEAAAIAVRDRFAATKADGTRMYSNRALGAWLGVSEGTVMKHRNGECACTRADS